VTVLTVTVLEVIQRSAEFLAQRGVDSPRLQVESILANVLALPRLQLYLNFQRELTESELQQVREMVKRRGHREPLQHILGSTSFCGLELKVTPAALIPRPETELLAERAWQFLSTLNSQPSTALDVGTGTGCIAIAIAVNAPQDSRDCHRRIAGSARIGERNAARHNVGDRIEFHFGDAFKAIPRSAPFDLIVSNPPYIPSGEIASLQPEVRELRSEACAGWW
jgi:release factor glutamine methyltransferase